MLLFVIEIIYDKNLSLWISDWSTCSGCSGLNPPLITDRLKMKKYNFDANMRLSKYATTEITWWIKNLDHSFGFLSLPPFQLTIVFDASPLGWGAVLGNMSTNGRWFPRELDLHINVREILAAYFAVKSFKSQVENKHVKLMVDNTTAVAVINHMGTNHSDDCNSAAVKLWTFCFEH